LPPFTTISGADPVAGYIAVSARCLIVNAARDGAFQWLKGIEPRERVGRSIFLYYIDPANRKL